MRRRDDAVASALQDAAPNLLRYLLRRTESPEAAADLFGETSLIAWRRRADAPVDPEALRPWLFVIARNALLNHWRASRRAAELGDHLLREAALAESVADPARRAEDVDLVHRLLADLPEAAAELVRLVHWDDLTLEQAAIVLGIPPSTARSRWAKVKEQLRAALRDQSLAGS